MSKQEVFYLDVDEITPDPDQPRQIFDNDDVNNFALTMLTQGQINPVEVNGHNVLVTGEIRWRALKRNVSVYPNRPELRRVKCTRWSGTPEKRFERQVIENLHHHGLVEQDRDSALVKLWESGEYPNQVSLGKAVGMSRQRIQEILEANTFRVATDEMDDLNISTTAISETRGLEKDIRVKILQGVDAGKVKVRELREIKKIAQASPELLEKTIDGSVSIERAIEAAKTVTEIEDSGVELTSDQRQRLADNMERDQDIIKNYRGDVLDRVKRTMTAPADTKDRVYEPIGRTSPVNYIIAVKDEIQDTFRRHIGNCDMSERAWARKLLVEIRDEVDELLALIADE